MGWDFGTWRWIAAAVHYRMLYPLMLWTWDSTVKTALENCWSSLKVLLPNDEPHQNATFVIWEYFFSSCWSFQYWSAEYCKEKWLQWGKYTLGKLCGLLGLLPSLPSTKEVAWLPRTSYLSPQPERGDRTWGRTGGKVRRNDFWSGDQGAQLPCLCCISLIWGNSMILMLLHCLLHSRFSTIPYAWTTLAELIYKAIFHSSFIFPFNAHSCHNTYKKLAS